MLQSNFPQTKKSSYYLFINPVHHYNSRKYKINNVFYLQEKNPRMPTHLMSTFITTGQHKNTELFRYLATFRFLPHTPITFDYLISKVNSIKKSNKFNDIQVKNVENYRVCKRKALSMVFIMDDFVLRAALGIKHTTILTVDFSQTILSTINLILIFSKSKILTNLFLNWGSVINKKWNLWA